MLKHSLLMTTAVSVVLGVPLGGVAQALTIDTATSWNGSDYVYPFGENNTATYGQTFTVGSDTKLDSFSFFLDGYDNPDVVDFAGYVMKWDGNKATGNILYESGQLSTTANTGFEEFAFNTGGINLNQGEEYVAFLSASEFFNGIQGTSIMGYHYNNVYDGGSFVFQNNGNNFPSLTEDNWSILGGDTAFKASFSSAQAIPEPVTILGTLFAGAFGIVFKRKSASV